LTNPVETALKTKNYSRYLIIHNGIDASTPYFVTKKMKNIKYSTLNIQPMLSLAVITLFIGGCQSSDSLSASSSKPQPPATTQRLVDDLQKLPAVEFVDTWQSEFGNGLLITTAHYEIRTTLKDPLMLDRLPGFVEAAYQGYQSQLPSPIPTQNKFSIYLFADRTQWEDFTKTFTGEMAPMYMKIKAGAYYLNGACVAYNIGTSRTFSVIGHEGWHQFDSRHFRYRLPSWLDEGIATLFEAGVPTDSTFRFDPAKNLNRLGALKLTIAKNKMIPIEQLIALNPGEVIVENDDAVMAFYAQSYALVRFLREDNYGRRLGRFHQMLLGAVNGTWAIEESAKTMAADRNIPLDTYWNRYIAAKIFENYITPDITPIQKEYNAFCNKITYYVRFGK
jgi:hypothetical protein